MHSSLLRVLDRQTVRSDQSKRNLPHTFRLCTQQQSVYSARLQSERSAKTVTIPTLIYLIQDHWPTSEWQPQPHAAWTNKCAPTIPQKNLIPKMILWLSCYLSQHGKIESSFNLLSLFSYSFFTIYPISITCQCCHLLINSLSVHPFLANTLYFIHFTHSLLDTRLFLLPNSFIGHYAINHIGRYA